MGKWDRRWLDLAEYVSHWSKDPSTKVGTVIAKGKRFVSLGYNGFPEGVDDSEERYKDRDLKIKIICHAEMNAIIFAQRDLSGCTIYTYPFLPCPRCAADVIQSGIRRCIAPKMPEHLKERWGKEMDLSVQIFNEAGVEVQEC